MTHTLLAKIVPFLPIGCRRLDSEDLSCENGDGNKNLAPAMDKHLDVLILFERLAEV